MFLMDLWRGQSVAAYEALAPSLREQLEAPLAQLAEHLEREHLPVASEMFVVARLDNPFDIQRMEVEEPVRQAPEVGHSVAIRLQYHDGRTGRVQMVWGGQRWYVDLPAPERIEALEQGSVGDVDVGEAPIDELSSDDE
jgi:hypothetical protein